MQVSGRCELQPVIQTASQYLNSRKRDAISLSRDIADSKGDLGYACFLNACTVSTRNLVQGKQVHKFSTPEEARAFILRVFW